MPPPTSRDRLPRLRSAVARALEIGDHVAALQGAGLLEAAGASPAESQATQARALTLLGAYKLAERRLAERRSALPPDASLLAEAAELRLRLGRFESALSSARRALRLDPSHRKALVTAARVHLWKGAAPAARTLLERVLSRHPGDCEAIFLRGVAHVLEGGLAEGEALLEALVKREPDHEEARLWLAEAALRSRNAPRALRWVEAHIARGFDSLSARILRASALLAAGADGWQADARRVAQDMRYARLPSEPVPLARALERLRRSMRGNRAFPETRTAGRTRRIVPVCPPVPGFRPDLRRMLVKSQAMLTRFGPEKAERSFALVFAMTRDRGGLSLAHCFRGEFRLWLGRLDEADSDFERALRLRPATRWARVGLCATATLRGELPRALVLADEALAAGAHSVLTWRAEARRLAGDLAGALADCDAVLAKTPERLGALLNRALARGAMGDERGMRQDALRARRAAPVLFAHAGRERPPLVLARCLLLLRGNRSSWMDCFFTPDGKVRSWRGPAEASRGRLGR